MALEPGSRLGAYEIVSLLGKGGMGEVYKARDTRLGRTVAIKVLPPDQVADPERKQRFMQEAKAASALNHPNIVTVHDIASDGGVDFIVMEYVEGAPLADVIPHKGLEVSQALQYAIQMTGALATAHAAGIVHRDLKPANIIVGAAGRLKLLDFGLAKLRPSGDDSEATRTMRTQEGAVLGTVAYMSPEQAEGRPVDARSDIFSFGVMLYQMLTGRRPFQGESTLSVLTAVLRDEPLSPAQINTAIPPELERIVLRCLRKDPARRFQHMEDLQVALEELKDDTTRASSIAVPRAEPSRRPWRWIAAGLAAIAALGVGLWFGRSPKAPTGPPPVLTPLTSYAGHVSEPTVSPDGNQVAFTWDGEKQDNLDIYIRLVGPGAPLRLTSDPARELSPAWSPDGRSIAFLRVDRGAMLIVLIPALGGPQRKIAEGMFAPGLNWSTDGQTLLAGRREPGQLPHSIVAISVATGASRRLTQPAEGAWSGDVHPALSPDGHTVAFSRGSTRTNSEIYLLPVSDDLQVKGSPRQLTAENRDSGFPAWTPDGRQVIFTAGLSLGARQTLMRIPSDAAAQTRATPVSFSEGGGTPVISRQGRLVFSRTIADENVWRIPLAGGKPGSPARLLFSTRRDIEPRYSPDGRKLAFSSDRSGTHEVWIGDADGSNAAQLTAMGAALTGGARWSPDGQRLAFLSTAAGQQELYVIGVNGGNPLRLTDHPAHESAPSWSRDGKWIYFASNRSGRFEVWKMAPDPKSTPVQVTRNGGFAAIESIDGRTLYFSQARSAGTQAVLQMPVEGGQENVVVPLINTWGDFDVTDRGIYYLTPGKEIRMLSFATGESKLLGTLEKSPSFGVAAAPDNSAVLYSQFDSESTELVMIENFR